MDQEKEPTAEARTYAPIDLSYVDTAIFRPEFCDTPREFKPKARPFSGSASMDNVFATIHSGANLGVFGVERLNTFIVLRAVRLLDTPCTFWSCTCGERRVYDGIYTPFGATRVIEESNAPVFNEVLVVNMPSDIRTRGVWGMVLELVARDSQDFLLASVTFPLDYIPISSEASMFVHFPANSELSPVLHVSFFRSQRRETAFFHRLELTAESISISSHPNLLVDHTILAVNIMDPTSPPKSDNVATVRYYQVFDNETLT
ncbi:hypothetical protein THRCLA_01332 [Thraustotheca clavata]|uniref:C2 domain-containing protein n=1 Tax=Thraustotheca clavata TaxID=74557 RepID=A0A1W0A8W1_9STRA|nr:hypothetical protein THRCLA_01332 [Thraustotheca clavata]